MSNDVSVVTPALEAVEKLVRGLCLTSGIGVIHGGCGTGKTHIMRSIAEGRYDQMGLGLGISYFHSCVVQNKNSSGAGLVKDLYVGISSKRMLGVSSNSYVLRATFHEIRRQSIHLLLIDECGYISKKGGSIEALLSLREYALTEKYPLAILMACSCDPSHLFDQIPAATSRIMKSLPIPALTLGEMAAVLKAWGLFADPSVLETDKSASKALREIFSLTRSGNFRRLSYFFALHKAEFPNAPYPTVETVSKVAEGMDR